jgi:signal transduction histidine kinase
MATRIRDWWRGLDPFTADLILALVLSLICQFELLVGANITGPRLVNHGFALLVTLPLAYRRAHPLGAVLVAFGAIGTQAVLDGDLIENPFTPFFVALVLSYSLGAHAKTDKRAVIGAAVPILIMWVELAVVEKVSQPGDYLFTPLVVVVSPWLAGRAVRNRALKAAALQELAIRLEREQEQRSDMAVADERSRIAREMHDVVAHSMSVMVIQAGAARKMLDKDPGRAAEALNSIEDTGRRGLAEMRRLLGVLRTEDDRAGLAPQPGMGRIDDLIERARRAGLPVDLSVDGEPRPLSPGVDLSAYRIVQEALTNTIKHAGAANARVRVRWGAHRLELDVSDDGQGPYQNENGSGNGLIGMQQRVKLYGGTLETGPLADGGYRVHATLPVGEHAA